MDVMDVIVGAMAKKTKMQAWCIGKRAKGYIALRKISQYNTQTGNKATLSTGGEAGYEKCVVTCIVSTLGTLRRILVSYCDQKDRIHILCRRTDTLIVLTWQSRTPNCQV
jgi:hypothetical protein